MISGQLIKQARDAQGLTQRDLAARAGLTQTAVYLIETGQRQPKYKTAIALARALGVPLTSLDPELTEAVA